MTAALAPSPAGSSLRERVAAECRAHLARRRMSGRALARALTEDQTWVSRRLNATIPMNLDDLERICSVLGIDPVELMRSAADAPTPGTVTPR